VKSISEGIILELSIFSSFFREDFLLAFLDLRV